MKPKYIVCNAFSLSMLDRENQGQKQPHYENRRMPTPTSLEQIKANLAWLAERNASPEIISAVGHADTAKILGNMLGIDLPMNRVSVKIGDFGDDKTRVIIGQYVGPRLPEGSTELPEGAAIEWWII